MNKYMGEANLLAVENLSTNAGGPFGAVVVKDGKIIGRGSNHVLADHDPTAHAEVMAIRDACANIGAHDLTGCELYTSCYPCPMCLSAVIWSNITTVYYGNTKEDAEAIGFRDSFIYKLFDDLKNDKASTEVLNLVPIDREETLQAFKDFVNKADKTIY